jgi:hypothetical protein
VKLVVDRTWGVWLRDWTDGNCSAGWIFSPEIGVYERFRGTKSEAESLARDMRGHYPDHKYEVRKLEDQ